MKLIGAKFLHKLKMMTFKSEQFNSNDLFILIFYFLNSVLMVATIDFPIKILIVCMVVLGIVVCIMAIKLGRKHREHEAIYIVILCNKNIVKYI